MESTVLGTISFFLLLFLEVILGTIMCWPCDDAKCRAQDLGEERRRAELKDAEETEEVKKTDGVARCRRLCILLVQFMHKRLPIKMH